MTLYQSSKELFQIILDLFSSTETIPITLYMKGEQGEIVEIASSNKDLHPEFCKTFKNLSGGTGQKACENDMNERVNNAFDSESTQNDMCHWGLTNVSDPIIVDNKVVAIIQYGAALQKTQSDEEVKENFSQTADAININAEKKRELEHLLLEKTPRREKDEWQQMSQTLIPSLKDLIDRYISQIEKQRKMQEEAYHEVQMSLQTALARCENFEAHFPENSQNREELEITTGAIDAAASVMHNLMGGKYLPEYRIRPRKISAIIQSTIITIKAEAEKKDIQIKIDLKPDDGSAKVYVSEEHIILAFINLMQNAVKYSYRTLHSLPQHRYIYIQGKKNPDYYQIVISNYGVGIDKSELSKDGKSGKIFQKGYRGIEAKKEYRFGAGLGLPIAKQIIEKHNGQIRYESTPMFDKSTDGPRPYLTRVYVSLPTKK